MKADNVALLEFIGASKRTFYIPVYQRKGFILKQIEVPMIY